MVVLGSCGGSDNGTSASPPSYPFFPLSLNVVNEYCMKSLRPASCLGWTVERATTYFVPLKIMLLHYFLLLNKRQNYILFEIILKMPASVIITFYISEKHNLQYAPRIQCLDFRVKRQVFEQR